MELKVKRYAELFIDYYSVYERKCSEEDRQGEEINISIPGRWF